MSLVTIASSRGGASRLKVRLPGERKSRSGSATRALDVLELFGRLRCPLRAIDIARMLDLHPSTVNQLLKTMVESAHLAFDANGKTYLPSPRLAEFGAWIAENSGPGWQLRALVNDLHDRTGMAVAVSMPNDLFMQIMEIACEDGHVGERGMRISLFGSITGSAYLATLDDAEILRLAVRDRVPEEEFPAVLAAVASIRRDGYADGTSASKSLWSIAMPLHAQNLSVPIVLGMAGPAKSVRRKRPEYCEAMRRGISRWIGDTAIRA